MTDSATDAVRAAQPRNRDELRAYWDQRHQQEQSLRSGGDLSFDEGVNGMLYAVRTVRLIEGIGARSDPYAPLHLLDAGCGKGHFSRAMANFGHRVDGIDTSAHAISLCTNAAGPREHYAVSSLAGWQPAYLYDVVYSVDVLFHIIEDSEWEASVRNLASLVRLGGRLLLADHGADADRQWADYQKTRALSSYQDLLPRLGMRWETFLRNDFKAHDPVGMHIATRVA